MKKIIAIASVGGHWVQLLRLMPAFNNNEIIFVTTKHSLNTMVPNHKFYVLPDFNRNNKSGILKSFFIIIKIYLNEKPDLVVTTGAAPGLVGLIFGKLFGLKTVWIDSIANVDELSSSGKIALRVADRFYTQWPDLANEKIIYVGNVLS